MAEPQKQELLNLVMLYVDNMTEGQAKVRMEEIERHLNQTHFAWIGGTDEQSVYYYRIHSPVIRSPNRQHIHAVIRTPNGNDYGKDLLRLHYQQHPHTDQ